MSRRAFVQSPTERDYFEFFTRQWTTKENYNQLGKGSLKYPFYVGLPVQRGQGIGAPILRFFTHHIFPLFAQVPAFFRSSQGQQFARNVAKHAINTGAQIVTDRLSQKDINNNISEPETFKKTAKRRFGELGKNIVSEIRSTVQQQQQQQQEGSGQYPIPLSGSKCCKRKKLHKRNNSPSGKKMKGSGRSRKNRKKSIKGKGRKKKAAVKLRNQRGKGQKRGRVVNRSRKKYRDIFSKK